VKIKLAKLYRALQMFSALWFFYLEQKIFVWVDII